MTTTNFTFNVTRSGNISQPASVEYEVVATNRFPVVAADFAPDGFPSGVVSFEPTETSKTVTIAFDGVRDVTEFAVNLKNPVGGEMVFRRASAIAYKGISAYLTVVLNADLWLDAADPISVQLTPGTNNVSQWTDKSFKNRHAIQTNVNRQPSYQNNSIVFTNHDLSIPIPRPPLFFDVFFVFKPSTASPTALFESAPFFINGVRQETGRWIIESHAISIELNATANTSNLIYLSNSMTTDNTYFKNGNFVTSQNKPPFTTWSWSAPVLGSLNAGSHFYNGAIQEVIFFSYRLTEDDRQIIEGYLAHKWGLVADLPANHPYKSVAPL